MLAAIEPGRRMRTLHFTPGAAGGDDETPLAEILAEERRVVHRCNASEDRHEGLPGAFPEKLRPNLTGR